MSSRQEIALGIRPQRAVVQTTPPRHASGSFVLTTCCVFWLLATCAFAALFAWTFVTRDDCFDKFSDLVRAHETSDTSLDTLFILPDATGAMKIFFNESAMQPGECRDKFAKAFDTNMTYVQAGIGQMTAMTELIAMMFSGDVGGGSIDPGSGF